VTGLLHGGGDIQGAKGLPVVNLRSGCFLGKYIFREPGGNNKGAFHNIDSLGRKKEPDWQRAGFHLFRNENTLKKEAPARKEQFDGIRCVIIRKTREPIMGLA
jgi:hypothetical protein